MKRLFIIALATVFSCTACTGNGNNPDTPTDEGGSNSNDESTLTDTAWHLIKEQGYERSGDYLEEWSDKADDFEVSYLFRDDHTGIYTTCEYFNGEEHIDASAIRWEYRSEETRLTIRYTEAGDERTYRVVELSADTMILVQHTTEPEYGYEYYNVETYASL